MERLHDNDESLIPHPDIHERDNQKHKPRRLPAPPEPEHLRNDEITRHHRPVCPPVVSIECAVLERLPFIGVAREPRNEELHAVRITDECSSRENELTHHINVLDGDDIMELVCSPSG